MPFISVFDVLGPNLVGPSSFHTACAISYPAWKMNGKAIKKAEFTL